MNWSRGLRRAWIGFTALWLAGCAFAMYVEWPEPTLVAAPPAESVGEPKWKSAPVVGGPKNMFEDLVPKKEPNYFDRFDPNPLRDHVMRFATYAFIWPAILFVLGWGMLWIMRGFRA